MQECDFNLFSACYRGEAGKIDQYLQEGSSVNAVATKDLGNYAKRGHTPLLVACNHRRVGIIKKLIELGANVNYRMPKVWTTGLMIAVSKQDYEIGKILVSAGADINAQDKKGNSVLMQSFYANIYSIEWLKFLLDNGANVFLENKLKKTVLDRAKAFNLEIVYELLETYRDDKVLDSLIVDEEEGYSGLLF